jgi:hypothetical protein
VSDPAPALRLVRQLRSDASTRASGIAVHVRGGAAATEAALRGAGANFVGNVERDPLDCERRVHELLRVPQRRELDCRLWFTVRADPPARFVGRAVNISVHGILADSAPAFARGATLEVSLTLPDDDVALRMTGQVIRTEIDRAAATHRHAVKFLLLKGDAQERIADFVDGGRPPGSLRNAYPIG